MASSREVLIGDLPPELLNLPHDTVPVTNWEQALRQWADQALARVAELLLEPSDELTQRLPVTLQALKHDGRPVGELVEHLAGVDQAGELLARDGGVLGEPRLGQHRAALGQPQLRGA